MAESYTHSLNALAAAAQAKYIPRDKTSFLMGSNGPDPMFYYKIYNPFRSYNLAILGDIMHITKTGIFLKILSYSITISMTTKTTSDFRVL